MKNLFLTVVAVLSFSSIASARGRIPVCFPCEYIETTQDLPNDTEFIGEFGEALNVGYRYKQISVIWVPFWNYEGEYCLVNEAEDVYYDLTVEDKAYLKTNNQSSFEGNPLGLWDKLGGKAILLVILLLVVWGYLPSKKKKAEAEQGNETA